MHFTVEGQHYRNGMVSKHFYAVISNAVSCMRLMQNISLLASQAFCWAILPPESRNRYGNQVYIFLEPLLQSHNNPFFTVLHYCHLFIRCHVKCCMQHSQDQLTQKTENKDTRLCWERSDETTCSHHVVMLWLLCYGFYVMAVMVIILWLLLWILCHGCYVMVVMLWLLCCGC